MAGLEGTLRRGLGLLWRGIRDEPGVFLLAVAGSAVYGVMTVGSAWVLGRVTDRVVLPAFQEGRTTAGALVGAGLAVVGWRCSSRSGSSDAGWVPVSCSTAYRPATAVR